MPSDSRATEAPTTGLYCFTLISNDGSWLWIGDERIIDRRAPHGRAPRNPVALEAAFTPSHRILQSAGRKHLEFFVEGPGLPSCARARAVCGRPPPG